jgi:hypothetical protein
MTRLKSALTGAVFTLAVCLTIIAVMLVVTNIQAVQADATYQSAPFAANDTTYYLPLTDAPPQRDITGQRFAPLETTP